MEHQNWKTSVLNTKKKVSKKEMHRNAFEGKGVQATMKTTTAKGGMTGKQMYNLIESESLEVPKVSTEFKQAMSQARLAKGMKQKDLAQRIGVKATVISGYESGKLIPDNKVIQRIEKVLGVKLPRMKKPKKNSMDY